MLNDFIDEMQGNTYWPGGSPKGDCPLTFKDAWAWADNANGQSYSPHEPVDQPIWKWDCGMKLDYDGPLISVSSRFYPPSERNGDLWKGDCHVYHKLEELCLREFECASLDELKESVEAFIKEVDAKIASAFKALEL